MEDMFDGCLSLSSSTFINKCNYSNAKEIRYIFNECINNLNWSS